MRRRRSRLLARRAIRRQLGPGPRSITLGSRSIQVITINRCGQRAPIATTTRRILRRSLVSPAISTAIKRKWTPPTKDGTVIHTRRQVVIAAIPPGAVDEASVVSLRCCRFLDGASDVCL